jgi:hypothetical protein
MQQQKLPRDLLIFKLSHSFLKSVDTGNFTMPLLQGLAQLLEVLSGLFNIKLGEKLLEHLRRWQEPEKLAERQKSWKAGEEPKMVAGELLYKKYLFIQFMIHLRHVCAFTLSNLVIIVYSVFLLQQS